MGAVKMQVKGVPEKTLLDELESRLRRDFTYNSGRIVGSMCTSPHPLARKMYARFLDKNLPITVFAGTDAYRWHFYGVGYCLG